MKASASSVYGSYYGHDKAIDGIMKNMFASGNEKHPWFAVDLGDYFKVDCLEYVYKLEHVKLELCLFSGAWNIHF